MTLVMTHSLLLARSLPGRLRTLEFSLRSFQSSSRCHSQEITEGFRKTLQDRLKASMKAKDKLSSTILRSVLADVYAADKKTGTLIDSSAIQSLLRKAAARREESAKQFETAARPELAENELKEAQLLKSLLPPQLSEAEIDAVLKPIISASSLSTADPKRSLGVLLKSFYQEVDRSRVEGELVKRRAEALLNST
ncbi:GatB/YqeY domain-containing protein [Sistotremastrum niveocremeum HHB9708]|uniref:Altered inheritance of mitochondria protein 41 n=1 Tax=Sistotremastrum niveocremeum HHB9708 TaxID=1314777 RepID=A0A165A2N0_9AGAM|nr:GatB/YqeY domain-containing protein [Sistotremastrum niveocremeum HHB9708]